VSGEWEGLGGLLRSKATSDKKLGAAELNGAETTRPGRFVASLALFPFTMEVQLQVSDYGTPVSVAPPPASAITSRNSCVASAHGFSC